MAAEARVEAALAKAKSDDERKAAENALTKVKEMRNTVLRLYVAMLLRGKPVKGPSVAEVGAWLTLKERS